MASAWPDFNLVFHRSNGRERAAARTQYATIVKNEVLRAITAEEVGRRPTTLAAARRLTARAKRGKEAETKGRT
jgi:hypothetical protein